MGEAMWHGWMVPLGPGTPSKVPASLTCLGPELGVAEDGLSWTVGLGPYTCAQALQPQSSHTPYLVTHVPGNQVGVSHTIFYDLA